MKRTLSLVLALVMILGTIPAFAAAPTVNEAAEFLNSEEVNVLRGNLSEGALMLEEGLKRQDSVIMLSRLLGEEDVVEATEGEPTWEDIADGFYNPVLKWAQDAKWYNGHSEVRFGYNEIITAQDYSLVLLRALGYVDELEVAWEDAYEKAIELGLLEDIGEKTEITRGEMAVMTFIALGTEMADGEGTLADALEIEMPEEEVEELEMTVEATGAKKLTVKFNQAVDTEKAEITVKKGSVSVNTDKIEFAEDKMSAVVTTTTNLTKGEYTVSVAGLEEEALTATVTVEDQKVVKIELLSDKAPMKSNTTPDNNKAAISYKVLNQYGEKASGQSINWTTSTGQTITDSSGTLELVAAGSSTFIPGNVVYLTGVHTASGTVFNGSVEVVLPSHVDEVVFKGVYNTTTSKVEALPAGFGANFVLLYEVMDQYGNKIANPVFSDLVFTSNNPLFVGSTFNAGADVTIDNVVYKSVVLVPGSMVNNGGTVSIQAISARTGKVSTYAIAADAKALVKSFGMSAPDKLVAEGEKVEIPFTAVDQYGNAVTKYSDLNGAVTFSPAFAGGIGLQLEQQNDGSAKLFYYAPATGASANADLLVYVTSLVSNGGEFSSLMINVKEQAVATAIIGVASTKATSIAAGNNVKIKAENLVIQDQYGRSMTTAQKNAFINGSDEIKVTYTGTAFTVTGGTPTTGGAIIANSTDEITFTANSSHTGSNALSVKFEIVGNTASAKTITLTRVAQASYESFEIADLGLMYGDAVQSSHNKTVKVYGVLANGSKVELPTTDFTVSTPSTGLTVSGNVISVTTPSAFGFSSTKTEAKAQVLVTVKDNATTGAALQILAQELTLSSAAPTAATITLADKVTAGNAMVNTTGAAITTDNLHGFVKEVKDQYGVVVATNTGAITITNVKKVSTSSFAVANNATSTANITGAVQGDKFTATFKYGNINAVVEFTVGLPQ